MLFTCFAIAIAHLWQRWNSIISPESNNGFDQQEFQQLIYPAITVCNLSPTIKITHKVDYFVIFLL